MIQHISLNLPKLLYIKLNTYVYIFMFDLVVMTLFAILFRERKMTLYGLVLLLHWQVTVANHIRYVVLVENSFCSEDGQEIFSTSNYVHTRQFIDIFVFSAGG